MATLVEWLDEGLEGAGGRIEDVLVIPESTVRRLTRPQSGELCKTEGGFYQAIAPLTTLAAGEARVRLHHNDIECGCLQKWAKRGTGLPALRSNSETRLIPPR